MGAKQVPLYELLPEIYRIRDEELLPPGQLRSYLSLVDLIFGALHANIEALYHDLFIETCADWVIPYLGDLLGTSPLSGDPWTLRADVADTILLRRRKGTLASIERLTYNLTKWGVHCVELRENLVWNQHLNHQRPDLGGDPPYRKSTRFTPVRGGTVVLRDPAMLSLLNTPFDPFAHLTDVKPPAWGTIRYNLPNLAIFLWRLQDYRVKVCRPGLRQSQTTGTTVAGEATHVVRVIFHPLGDPVQLFNTHQYDPDREPPVVTELDETPGPIPRARLSEGSEAGRPEKYVALDTYDPALVADNLWHIADVGLQFHLPDPEFTGQEWPGDASAWTIRGENLCAWEQGLHPPLKEGEIAIDPVIGRALIGVGTVADGAGPAKAQALETHLLVTYTYGAVGPVGAHPLSRPVTPATWQDHQVKVIEVDFHKDPDGLQQALDNLEQQPHPLVIEIKDSMTHVLDLDAIQGRVLEDGGPNLCLHQSLWIRAASGARPMIKLKHPLRFRPRDAAAAGALRLGLEVNQLSSCLEKFHNAAAAGALTLRLEGLYLARDESFPADQPLIARAALDSLEIHGCTLDPGGQRQADGTRRPIQVSLRLKEPYGFGDPAEEAAFKQTPLVYLRRTMAGPLLIDRGYQLELTCSIVDAGKGVGVDPGDAFAVSGATDPGAGWGPPTHVTGLTFLGRMRVESLQGRGGIWVHALEVLDNQKGCLRYSYFSGVGDRLPQNLGCVRGTEARLGFLSEVFGQPAYGQVSSSSDFRIRERGPEDDAMGAFGFLKEAHKWRNLRLRFREFMPVGIRPLLISAT